MSRVNLAIIGGGLVGASLALALQAGAKARGWKILMIEPFAPGDSYQPSYDARSSALSYGAKQIYQRLGLWQDIARRAEPIKQIHVSDRGRFSTARLSALEEGVPALGYVVENAWLGQCLWQGLDKDVVSWRCPAEVTRMEPLPDGYRLTLNDETVLECDLAVLADGGRSGLREQLGIGVKTRPYNQSALIANITPSEAHNGEAFERFTDDGPMALLPLPDNRCALVWTRIGMDAQRLANLDERSFLSELQGVFGYRLGTLKQVGARHLYPLTLVEAEEQVRSHLAILGNAAHSLHPIAGQGFNLSLRDAQALAEALLAGPQVPGDLATLQGYRERQRLDQKLTVGFSDQVTRLFGSAQPLVALGRNMGLLGLDLLPPAKRWFARQAMGKIIGKKLFPDPSQQALVERFATQMAGMDKRAYLAALDAIFHWDIDIHFQALAMPVFIMAADQDYTPVASKRAFAAQFQQCEIEIIANSRHATPLDQAQRVNTLLQSFLATHSK